ncbi:NPC intracellular cholesterol transporter 1 [Dionaea muscipula]
MEVIPFLVLAVGVDNMCILVHAVKRQSLDFPLEVQISNALVEVGPSITLASLSERPGTSLQPYLAAARPDLRTTSTCRGRGCGEEKTHRQRSCLQRKLLMKVNAKLPKRVPEFLHISAIDMVTRKPVLESSFMKLALVQTIRA